MFDPTSRYTRIEQATTTLADGRAAVHLRRRFLPQGRAQLLLAEATLGAADRLDLVAARALGDPEAFWRVCDANDAMNPADLETPAGRRLRVPVPEA